MLGLSFGLEYGIHDFEVEQTADPGDTSPLGIGYIGDKDDVKSKRLGVFAGYKLPAFLRFWGKYYFSSNTEVKGKANSSDFALNSDTGVFLDCKGSGFGFGVGYEIVPMVSINHEFNKFTYDEVEVTGSSAANAKHKLPSAAGPAIGSNGEMSSSEIIVSVSFPINI